MKNIERAQDLLRDLYSVGVRDICLCSGARNAPFVFCLAQQKGFQVYPFFEERSASFFALGRAKRDRRPTAVIVTSGTAVAELLPATVEAHYTGVPLILVTADRPARLRGTGAPQAIEQVAIFKNFVEFEADLQAGHRLSWSEWSGHAPAHINICFDEPLLDAEVVHQDYAAKELKSPLHLRPAEVLPSEKSNQMTEIWNRSKNPLVIVGGFDRKEELDPVRNLLLRLNAPVYAEATSGLREDDALMPLLLKSGDRLLSWAIKHNVFDCVLRLGSVPTVRVWRDFEASTFPFPVLSVSRWPFSGLSRGTHWQTDLRVGAEFLTGVFLPKSGSAKLRDKAEQSCAQLEILLQRYPLSEAGLVHNFSNKLAPSASLYLGNSLPIREWDLAASRKYPHWPQANRGANGIDGQFSSFLGGASQNEESWAILGDLTALYDLAGPWAAKMLRPEQKLRMMVINNGGGKIFSSIFNDPLFENRHNLEFSHFAKGWDWSYQRWQEIPASMNFQENRLWVELVPDLAMSNAFEKAYLALWV